MLRSYDNWLLLIEIIIIFAQINPENSLWRVSKQSVIFIFNMLCIAKYFTEYSKPLDSCTDISLGSFIKVLRTHFSFFMVPFWTIASVTLFLLYFYFISIISVFIRLLHTIIFQKQNTGCMLSINWIIKTPEV